MSTQYRLYEFSQYSCMRNKLTHQKIEVQQQTEVQRLATDCWPHVRLSVNRCERSYNQFMCDMCSARRVPQSLLAF